MGPEEAAMDSLEWLLPLLRCPACRRPLHYRELSTGPGGGLLEHHDSDCHERYPVIDGVPRLLTGPARSSLARAKRAWFGATAEAAALAAAWSAPSVWRDELVRGFDDEWRRHPQV